MTLAYPVSPRGRFVHLLDGLLVVWVAAWIVVGLAVYHQVRGLATLSDTLGSSATAIDQTASALVPLEQLPFVGGRIGGVVEQIRTAARSAHQSAESSRGNARTLSVLLGFSVALAPTVPLVGLYVPLRVSRAKEVRAVRRTLRRAAGDPDFEEFLARRAAENLPFHRLRDVSRNPWRDLEHGEYGGLARAELARLGIVRGRRSLRPAPDAAKDESS